MSRRTALLDAAVQVVGSEGIRALTHRRVDEQAGVATGSTSNVFRTRRSLVEGVLDRLLEVDRERAAQALGAEPPTTAEGVAEAVTAFLTHALGPDVVRTRARFAVFAEATNEPTLSAAIGARRQELLVVTQRLLAAIGVGRSGLAARAISEHMDGFLLHALSGGDRNIADFRAVIERHIRAWID